MRFSRRALRVEREGEQAGVVRGQECLCHMNIHRQDCLCYMEA